MYMNQTASLPLAMCDYSMNHDPTELLGIAQSNVFGSVTDFDDHFGSADFAFLVKVKSC